MKLIDISMPVSPEMMVYKNREEKKPIFKPMKTYDNSDFYESRLDLDLHTGTHVDTPLHMLENGATMEQIELDHWHGKAKVIDLTSVSEAIHVEDLREHALLAGDIVLLKTKNSLTENFDPDFVYLAEDAAEFLSQLGVKGVGIDALGIERAQANHATHKRLFESQCFILEGLRLAHVDAGRYYLMALPINLVGTEASPVRAVLLQED